MYSLTKSDVFTDKKRCIHWQMIDNVSEYWYNKSIEKLWPQNQFLYAYVKSLTKEYFYEHYTK